MIKKILLILTISLGMYANDVEDIKIKFQAVTNTIITVVQNKQYTQNVRNNIIVETITPMFDFKLMAKLSLGKKWKTLDQNQSKEFVSLYVNRMKQSYSSKVDKYTDEKIIINSLIQPISKKTKKVSTTRAILSTSLVSSGEKVKVVYKFHKPRKQIENKNIWLAYDVIIGGVSIVKTDKAQFRAVLKESTINQLMELLRK